MQLVRPEVRIRRKLLFALTLIASCKGSEQQSKPSDSPSASSTSVAAAESAQAKSDECGGDLTIRGERVGNITIGDPVESLSKCKVVRDTVRSDEGGTTRQLF